jgi:hypothetical protein
MVGLQDQIIYRRRFFEGVKQVLADLPCLLSTMNLNLQQTVCYIPSGTPGPPIPLSILLLPQYLLSLLTADCTAKC